MATVGGQLGNANAIGNSGGSTTRSKSNRELAAEVRELGLKQILKLFRMKSENKEMSDKERELYETVLVKMAPNFIPKLQEITGDDGAPIPILGYGVIPLNKQPEEDVSTNNSTEQTGSDEEEDPSSAGGNLSSEDNRDSSTSEPV